MSESKLLRKNQHRKGKITPKPTITKSKPATTKRAKILWLSEEQVTPEHLSTLSDIFGEVEIKHCSFEIEDWRHISEVSYDCNALFIEKSRIIIQSVLDNIADLPVIRPVYDRQINYKIHKTPTHYLPERIIVAKCIGWERINRSWHCKLIRPGLE